MPLPISRTPTLAELLNYAAEKQSAALRVALPARVKRYDADAQVVDVEPAIGDRFEGADGEVVSLALPVVCNVPLIFPGAGPWSVTFPVAVDDTVMLVFSDRSIDAWTDQGGVTNPDDARRHHISDAVAYPGLRNAKNKITDVNTSVMSLGKQGEEERFVAIAPLVKARLDTIHDALNAHVGKTNDFISAYNTAMTSIKGHTHVVSGAAAAASVALIPLNTPPPSTATDCGSIADVASATVKIKG